MANKKFNDVVIENLCSSDEYYAGELTEQEINEERKVFLHLLGRMMVDIHEEGTIIPEIQSYELNDEELKEVFEGFKFAINNS